MIPSRPRIAELDPAPALSAALSALDSRSASVALSACGARSAAVAAQAARHQAAALILEEGLTSPRFCFQSFKVATIDGEILELANEEPASCAPPVRLHAPPFAHLGNRLATVAAAACTLGPALEARVSALCAVRRMSLAHALDELGNGMLMYTARCATLAIRRELRSPGVATGDALTPGGRGLGLDQQEAVLRLCNAEALGIRVTAQGMLSPVKSRSLLIPVGAGLTVQPTRKRCEGCSSAQSCRYRNRRERRFTEGTCTG